MEGQGKANIQAHLTQRSWQAATHVRQPADFDQGLGLVDEKQDA
jgi:hypothetical protein